MTRSWGTIVDTGGLGPHDHVCWAYDNREDRRQRVVEFLADGLDQGQQVCHVGDEPVDILTAELAGLGNVERLVADGALVVARIESVYRTPVVAPAAQSRTFADMSDSAVGAGFTGLRIASLPTSMVRTPAQLDAFARYEHFLDRAMLTKPLSVLCAYDADELGRHVVDQLACMHPASNTATAGFHLCADENSHAALQGDIDIGDVELLGLAIERLDAEPTGGAVTIDARQLGFINHHGLIAIDEHARRTDTTVALRARHDVVARLVEVLDLTHIRVET
jgi:anti-anti-sigma regulatory factor